MARNDWYRKTTWSEADQADFRERLNRARSPGNKAQYLRIQADFVSEKYPEAALDLLLEMLRNYPKSIDVGQAELQCGEIYLKKGNVKAGIEALERAFEHQDSHPNIITQAWSVYGLAVIRNKLTELYDEAERRAQGYKRHAVFPRDRFHMHAILAVINQHRGKQEVAVDHARAALDEIGVRHSGFSRHPEVGLVENPDRQLVADPRQIVSPKSWWRWQ